MSTILDKAPITIYSIDEVVSDNKHWELGLWFLAGRKIWGLLYFNSPTHMCYDLDSNRSIREHSEDKRERFKDDPNPDWLRWYFDVGARLYVTLEDLEVASKTLGIWNGPTILDEEKK